MRCNIQYTANEATGLYAVALQIEDFASTTDTVPLSSIPLQFVIEVFYSTAPCGSHQPEFVGGTRCAEVSSTYRERIVAQSGGFNIRISDITITASPVGLLKSNLTASTTPQQWFVDVTWTPSSSQSGSNILCYYAVNCIGVSSPQTCITLSVVQALQVIRSSISPTGLVDPSETQLSVEFDRQFQRPTRSRFIRIYDANTDTEVVTIDVSTSSAVMYPTTNSGRTLSFSTNYNFTYGARYYLLLDAGVALGDQYCYVESAAVRDPKFWTFTVAVFLSSEVYGTSASPNCPCLEDTLVYTCTTSDILTWTVGTTFIGAYISGQGTTFAGSTRTNTALPGVVANLTSVDDTLLTSTLIISPAGAIGNVSDVICEGLSGIKNRTVLHPNDQSIIRLSGRNQTNTTSIVITLIYNLSIAMNATNDIQGTAIPVDDNSSSIVVTLRGPITTPDLKVPFTGLHADTTYSLVFEAMSRDNSLACLGVGITDLSLQTDRQRDPTVLPVLSTGAAVGIPISTSLVSFFTGALLVVLITCCCVRRRKKKSTGQLQVSYVHPSPIYSEVEPKQLDTLEMNENVAYGPVRH